MMDDAIYGKRDKRGDWKPFERNGWRAAVFPKPVAN